MASGSLAAPASTTAAAPTTVTPASGTVRPFVASGVWIGGVDVSGLDRAGAAAKVVNAWMRSPIRVQLGSQRFERTPARLGLGIDIDTALNQALTSGPAASSSAPVKVPLSISITSSRVKTWVDTIERDAYRPPINARYRLRKGRPIVYAERKGQRVNRGKLTRAIYLALQQQGSARTAAVTRPAGVLSPVPAAVSVKQLKPVVVVDRSKRELVLWSPRRRVKRYQIAVGQPQYPTPLGTYSVLEKQRNPWWRPPASDWAKDAEPIPPGPNNPLGTRWIGIGNAIGIHGTNNPGSIGSAASHGCMRMRTAEVEDLYRRLPMGTPVHVVA
jgi:lipoprotein-anchoring transpeptidase ErfK/SrfK